MKKTDQPHPLTEAQIRANRENAKKSTGPRTTEGKAASSRNRLLHGLRANKHIVLDEDPEDFLVLLHDLYDRFHPVGGGEEDLVLRIAADQWRLSYAFPMQAGILRQHIAAINRVADFHQELFDDRIAKGGHPVPPVEQDQRDLLARAFEHDCAGPNNLAALARYETAIERSLERCLRLLQKYQAARQARTPDPLPEPVPAPQPPAPQNCPPGAREPEMTPAGAAAPENQANYHSNPKNEGIAQSRAAALPLLLYGLVANLFYRRPPAANRAPIPIRRIYPGELRAIHAC